MAITPYKSTQNVKDLAQNQRDTIASRGDALQQDQGGQIAGNEALRNDYRSTLDRLYQKQAEGQGGYSPEEIAQIQAQGGMPQSLTDEQAAGNYLTPEEQARITGDTGSYTRNFDPTALQGQQDTSAWLQRGAVSSLKSGLAGDINNDALSQSGAFQQNSENQLGQNKGEFGTVLGAVGNNVRGTIDPSAVTASDSFLKDYNMSPEEQQQIVTGAGISAGAKDAAAVDAAERSARAAGSDPLGVAAYRARMSRASAADAGDAMTQARIKASEAAAGRKLTGEQLREQGGQYLTNVRSGTEAKLGEQALSGTQALGEQALSQRNLTEAQRLQSEQAKTGLNLGATEAGGNADIANEANINSQGRQVGQFNTTTGTGIAQAQDAANSGRAAGIAGNRQQTATGNQGTQFAQNQANNNTQSARATGVANTRLGAQQTGLNYYTGQNEQANQNDQAAQNRQVSLYGTQAGATNQAAGLQADAAKQPGTLSKIVGTAIGAVGALGAAGGSKGIKGLADGGVVSKPTVALIGEDGPEMVVPLGYRARAKTRPSVAMAAQPVRKGRMPYMGAA